MRKKEEEKQMIDWKFVWSVALALMVLASSTQAGTVGGGTPTLGATPSAVFVVNGPSQVVQSISIQVVPGYACKVYVGVAGFNKTSLVGVFAVLYPNATGGHSERFTIADPRGIDSIDVSTIHAATDCAGEKLAWQFHQANNQQATRLVPFVHSLVTSPTAGFGVTMWGGSTTFAYLVTTRVLPGFVGKVGLAPSCCSSPWAILYPNSGNPNQSSATSEQVRIEDKNGGLRPDLMYVVPDVAGEGVLVTAWKLV